LVKYKLVDIERVVNNNEKQRFKLKLNSSSKFVEIKANQGHSIDIFYTSVKSGMRKDFQVLIYIDLKKTLKGLKFYEVESGVILTEGDVRGFLNPKYNKKNPNQTHMI
ncbi:tRNA 2'-phosphotransferase 1-like, partial [Pieris brassicae]|uniref:tRNA 2'-phosphotransferase 1-like n=1 Tax=Pieris brassicae TaxID=7116 RepID=UPI001E661DE8